jgi:Protein of unknown function (DUF1176)
MRWGMIALGCGATALMAIAGYAVSPNKTATFKDWTVGCDNGLACKAVALMADGPVEGALSLVAKRPTGATAPLTLEMSGFTAKSDRYRIVIDGKVADTGRMQVGSETIAVSGADAIKLARALAKGKAMRLIDGGGTDLGGASLVGASAAFRYADAAQGRAGSKGAIIAVGPKMATAKKASLPVITAKKIKPSDILPDTEALVALSESSPCAAERFGPTEDSAYSLGSGTNGPQALVLLNCGAGAYNFSSGVYVGQRDAKGKWAFSPAKFDYNPTRLTENANLALMVNADWDSNGQTLSGYSKGRGIGDCGSSESYVWNGTIFRLKEAMLMDECRGSLDWIAVWRAEVKLSD